MDVLFMSGIGVGIFIGILITVLFFNYCRRLKNAQTKI